MSYPGVTETDTPTGVSSNAGQQVPEAFRPTGSQLPEPQTPVPVHYGGSSWARPEEYDFVTPSGTRCRIKKVRVEDALALGVLEDIDLFTAKLMENADGTKRKATPEEVNSQVLTKLSDGNRSGKFFGSLNKLLTQAIVAPKISLTDNGNLPDDTIFVDWIEFTDKMAIFREVFQKRMEKIEPFREGQEAGVGSVEPGVSVQSPSE